MEIPFQLDHYFEDIFSKQATALSWKGFHPQVRLADAKFGDFQANGVLAYAKEHALNPREQATLLLEALNKNSELRHDWYTFSIAGPGFINITLTNACLLTWLKTYQSEVYLQRAASNFYAGKRITLDFSSPNTAKQMHVGHIRSTVIGDTLQRLLRFCGADVLSDNHIGDWGTQFGILIMAIKRFHFSLEKAHEDPLEELEVLYKKGNELFKEDPTAQKEAYKELVKLQNGDPENLRLWEAVNKISYAAFEEMYQKLGVHFDLIQGESFYRDSCGRIYKELEETGIAEISEGALVVFNPGPDGQPFPFIIRKTDGASNYATTDLATILYHALQNKREKMIYVTDARQKDHFNALFATARRWFAAKNYPLPEFEHVTFGSILGEDGKAIKTRSGNPIRLKALLNEGIARARAIVEAKNPALSDEEKDHIAHVVGIGSIRYADLSQSRTSDYTFSWDKILNFEGNTAPYMLYAVSRIYSIFQKAQKEPGGNYAQTAAPFETKTERTLAKKLLEFPIHLGQTVQELCPHHLCAYLFELAGVFSSFYREDKVLVEDPHIQNKRLLLCQRTLQFLETGLHLLGIQTLEKM